jgi:hypothetical protein
MKTVNSLSGGKTSSYIAANYPADYDVFALVRTDDKNCSFPDKKLIQEVEDRIQAPFVGTLEDDTIIYTMLDLEQYIGREITWVTGKTFDEIIDRNGKTRIPQVTGRFCTNEMKVKPIQEWWYKKINEPVDMRIGFRANELRRVVNTKSRLDEDGFETDRIRVKVNKNKNDKWKNIKWRTVSFPLVDDNIYKDTIEEYWKDKPVRFAWQNNCIGCFHSTPLNLSYKSRKFPNKFDWFVRAENKCMKDYNNRKWYKGDYNNLTYEQVKEWKPQTELFDDDFNECDSGYCGV